MNIPCRNLFVTLVAALSIVAVIFFGPADTHAGVAKLYWTDEWAGKIQRANPDGTDLQDLVSRVFTEAIALDLVGGKMYWPDDGGIKEATLEGTGTTLVISGVSSQGIAVDGAGGKIYWADQGVMMIRRADLDGDNMENLVDLSGIGPPLAVALDAFDGKIYWTIDGGLVSIQRANLDGTDVEDLVPGSSFFEGIALDLTGNKIYWTDEFSAKIWRANLDGSATESIVSFGSPEGIAIDVVDGKMYWTDDEGGGILRANLDGSDISVLVTGLGGPGGIALVTNGQIETCSCDLNEDGSCNFFDWLVFIEDWGRTDCP
jgi:DNA-binding beta-propeller fold protein YncE